MRRILLGLVVLLVGPVEQSFADELAVAGFSHPPNYARSTDSDDIRQLTDGALASFPIWTKKETVGWAATTPIAIQLQLSGKRGGPFPQAGTLRLHSAKGLSSGVDVPRHIDVYARDASNRLSVVGSLAPDSERVADKSTYWLDVPVQGATDSLVVVVHAAGAYIFLDEVRWEPAGVGQLPTSTTIEGDVRAALKDSTRRVSKALIQGAELEAEKAAVPVSEQAIVVWNEDPWGDIGAARAARPVSDQVAPVELRGYAGEHESACIGLVVGQALAESGLRVTVSGAPHKALKLYEVKPVVSANKKRVYDPLVPVEASGTLSARAGIPLYLWIDVDLAALGAGTHEFQVHLEGGPRTVTIPGHVVINPSQGNMKRPHGINWAYRSDMPIFQNASVVVQDLLSHGIDTFVAHPSEIPGSALDGTWSLTSNSHFQDVVRVAQQHGKLLLYLGWSETKNPVGFSSQTPVLSSSAKDRLTAWMKKLVTYLSEQGLSADRWALYVVDEPTPQGLKLIKAVAEAVKQWNPAVQVYSTLNAYSIPPIEVSDLRTVANTVDLWQPNRLILRGPIADFFKQLPKEWWFYGNPLSPAKQASPLHNYRMLAWWAWYYGAAGVGFWSYSDTAGSSAWDDIDGRRPDWAVVYETPSGIVSSRRWEAFREGLEDYALLSGRERTHVLQLMGPGEQNFDHWTSGKVNEVRKALLPAP